MTEQRLKAELDKILSDAIDGIELNRMLSKAIKDHNSDAIDAVYCDLPNSAQRIIDCLIAIAWNVPVSSLSVIEEC